LLILEGLSIFEPIKHNKHKVIKLLILILNNATPKQKSHIQTLNVPLKGLPFEEITIKKMRKAIVLKKNVLFYKIKSCKRYKNSKVKLINEGKKIKIKR